jgi:hypothetical protein
MSSSKEKTPTKPKPLPPNNFNVNIYNHLTACIACETMHLLSTTDFTTPLQQKEVFKIYNGGDGIESQIDCFLGGQSNSAISRKRKNLQRD